MRSCSIIEYRFLFYIFTQYIEFAFFVSIWKMCTKSRYYFNFFLYVAQQKFSTYRCECECVVWVGVRVSARGHSRSAAK